ncbi:ABC transporter permease [Bacteroides sp. 214]|uniref:ABC transporter permease n=1 Tax=Bacteroides sp. 214 TaxID=2302935 RepID=UPI0013D4AD22|nr:ABC transporter permease [Bacteroides sp. 214]NDW12421.1 ABC transporter permease [Bacteroides sp. 214]
MYKQYIKQFTILFKENKLLSIISIIGTAMAISIIMVVIILLQAKTADYAPESNRSRTLYVKWAGAINKENAKSRSFSRLSLYSIQQVFYPLETAEAVSAIHPYGPMLSSLPGSTEEISTWVTYTDAAFWRVNDFQFVAGRPYDQASFEAGFKQAVICESVAKQLFGSAADAIDKPLDLNFVNFTVVGVVKDVSKFLEICYSEVWLPYTSNAGITQIDLTGWGEGKSGNYLCLILARSKEDFSAIRQEVETNVKKLNSHSERFDLDIAEQPNEFFAQMLRKFANQPGDVKGTVIRYGVIIFVILLVPGINLSGLTLSRMRKRLAELGVRKAFGANRSTLLWQVINENFILTLIGGVVGLLLSYLSLWVFSGWLMASDLGGVATVNASMISPWIFLVALAFCLLLNLMSAGIPAWRVTRVPIVNALNEK